MTKHSRMKLYKVIWHHPRTSVKHFTYKYGMTGESAKHKLQKDKPDVVVDKVMPPYLRGA